MKLLPLSIMSFALGLFSQVQASSMVDAISNGAMDGEIRSVLYARNADGTSGDGVPYLAKASGVAMGGFIGYTTQALNHIKARAAVYTAQPVVGDGNTLTKSNVVNGEDGFTLLGEAYLQYDNSVNKLTIGRQEMYTPLVASDDGRMIKDLFSGVSLSTKLIPNHTLSGFYLNKMSGVDNFKQKKDWVSMSKVLGASYDRGMYALGVKNTSFANLAVQLWGYHIPDTVNMIFSDLKYQHKVSDDLSLTYEAHYWRSRSQDRYETDTSSIIDYNFSGVRVSAEIDKFTLQLAFDHMSKESGSKTIHEAHGNFAEYTYGFLIGSGAYGAQLAPINPNTMTSMNATKLTMQYHYNSDTNFYVGYMMANSDAPAYQSDANIMDIALFINNIGIKNMSLAFIYENWAADGNNFFVDNNLVRATLKYKF